MNDQPEIPIPESMPEPSTETETEVIKEKEPTIALWKLIAGAVVVILAIFLLYNYFDNKNNGVAPFDDSVIDCIASDLTFFTLQGCLHCADQKELLGEHLSKFNEVDCTTQSKECTFNQVQFVPAWKNSKGVLIEEGVKSWEELRVLAEC